MPSIDTKGQKRCFIRGGTQGQGLVEKGIGKPPVSQARSSVSALFVFLGPGQLVTYVAKISPPSRARAGQGLSLPQSLETSRLLGQPDLAKKGNQNKQNPFS